MRALQRKLWRDFWLLRGQSLAIALVIIGGIATLVMAMSNHQALKQTRERFYEQYRYADVFASLKRAPLSVLEEVAALPGVRQAEGRVMVAVNLDLPGFDEAVTAQVVSLPPEPEGLNQLYLRSGRLPEHPWEVVVGEAFAQAHRLHPGDRLGAIVNGRWQALVISGVGLSPEFIYQIRPGDLFPDFERFTVLWMQREALAAAFDLAGAFNQLVIALESGAASGPVVDAVDRLLQPYGGMGAHGRDLQMSHRFLDEELTQLATMTRLFSSIFLAVTAFLLNVVIGRLIGTQREQIAVLKAFGYSGLEVARHYAALVLLMVGVGVLPGVLLGAWMGRGMAELYMTFYRFPFLDWTVQPQVWGLALAFAVTAALLGTVTGLRRAFRLAPAEAMRPEAPAVFRRTWSERLGLGAWLDPAALMVARHLERRPWRTLLSVIGIGLAGGILVMSRLQSGAIDEMIHVQFGLAQRDDLTVTFAEATDWRAVQELQRLPGVRAVEPYRQAPVKLRHAHREYTTALLGLPEQGTLKRVLDADRQPAHIPPEGLMLTDHLAQMLGVGPGDVLEVVFLDGRRDTLWLPVATTVTEYLGVGAYVNRRWLNRLLLESDVVSGAWLLIDAAELTEVLHALRERPRVAAVADRGSAIDSFMDTMAESMLTFSLIITFMAASIAVGVVYNAARITLAERSRDLASLRILGYTPQEVRNLLLGELATLVILALLPGFAIGYGLSALLVAGMQSDLYRIPLVVTPAAFALSGIVVLLASGLSAWVVVRRLRRLDLVAVLKTRE